MLTCFSLLTGFRTCSGCRFKTLLLLWIGTLRGTRTGTWATWLYQCASRAVACYNRCIYEISYWVCVTNLLFCCHDKHPPPAKKNHPTAKLKKDRQQREAIWNICGLLLLVRHTVWIAEGLWFWLHIIVGFSSYKDFIADPACIKANIKTKFNILLTNKHVIWYENMK